MLISGDLYHLDGGFGESVWNLVWSISLGSEQPRGSYSSSEMS